MLKHLISSQMESNNQENTRYDKSMKVEGSIQFHMTEVKMVPLRQITRDQLGELLPYEPSQSNTKEKSKSNNSMSKKPKQPPRYCTYCGEECPYKHNLGRYSINCSIHTYTRLLPKYCNICGKEGDKSLMVHHLNICCGPEDSECMQISKENPYC